MNTFRVYWSRLLVVGFLMLMSSSAWAVVTGTATGTFKYHNKLAGYAHQTMNTTGMKYDFTQYDHQIPLRDIKVYVRDSAGNPLGVGSTNYNGTFSVAWRAPSAPGNIRVTFHLEHKNGRFKLLRADGTTFSAFTPWKAAVAGGTTVFGNVVWGSSANPERLSHYYASAERFIWDVADLSTRLTTKFVNVTGYLEDPTTCPLTACSDDGGRKKFYLGPNMYFDMQNRMLHEMGHVASDVSHVNGWFWKIDDYNYTEAGCPATECTTGWGYEQREYYQPGGEEATAQTFADFALFFPTAVDPRICMLPGGGYCDVFSSRIELSSGALCATGRDRWMLNQMRVLWDLYDSAQDVIVLPNNVPVTDLVSSGSVHSFAETLARFSHGAGGGQDLEGWNCPFLPPTGGASPGVCSWGNRDARTITDFALHFNEQTGLNIGPSLTMNCW
jgi:hypothetical protein